MIVYSKENKNFGIKAWVDKQAENRFVCHMKDTDADQELPVMHITKTLNQAKAWVDKITK